MEKNIKSIQQQLDISRERAREFGIQAVETIHRGFYLTPSGNQVDIHIQINESVSGTVTYSPEMSLPISANGQLDMEIEVWNTTTLAAISELKSEGYQPAALNMASATSPGGGFLFGARAQEEYLARSSSLFACLRNNPMYERRDFDRNPFYDDYVIYSPGVVVFRDDDGDLLENPYTCSIITSPAVQASAVQRYMPSRIGEIEDAMWNRILKVMAVAHMHGHKALVLGAWGCGAFGNDGVMIAGLFKRAFAENFKEVFEKVIFAITDWSPEQRFIGPFQKVFK